MPTNTPILMISDEIELTADDDRANSRVRRLERLVGYVQALADAIGDKKLLDKVKAIHDHEGCLTITWKQPPTETEKKIFYKGWDSRVCDGGDASLTTEHEMAEGEVEMQIDLTKGFTTGDVANLLASKDDSQHRQLRITKGGIAYISDEVGADNIDGLACRFETWVTGNGYCGLDASQDADYVLKTYNNLKENWPNPQASYIDF